MNTLSINNSQPSFQGVKITSNFTHVKRPFTYINFHIVPDSELKGIKVGNQTIKSTMADELTRRFSNVISFKQLDKNSILIDNTNDFSNFNLMAFLKILISHEAGFSPKKAEKVVEFMQDQAITVQRTKGTDCFDILFGRDLVHELEILQTPHPGIKDSLDFDSAATNQAL